ncbi:MAG TPA: hypothetical protein ENK31_08290, partial [Nannocystis exedens]|nr:hypothetical protein [Nannocystis exedens]
SPVSKLLGLVIDANGGHGERRILVAPTLTRGRLFTELLRPVALLVDTSLSKDQQELLLAAASVVGARPTILGGDGAAPPGFAERISATTESIHTWLEQLCTYSRPAVDTNDPLAVLRARYANSLGQKATDLAKSLAAVPGDSADTAALQAAQELAHRFRGSAGTYGFPAFGEVAAAVDDALRESTDPQDARRRQAASHLALWSAGADPFATTWPVIVLSGGHQLLGTIAAQSQGLRVAIEPERAGITRGGGHIGRIVEVDQRGEPDAATTISDTTSNNNSNNNNVNRNRTNETNRTTDTHRRSNKSAIQGDRTQEHLLLVHADEVQISATGEHFPRRALGDRLPALIESWIGAQVMATTDGVAI